MPTGKRAAIYVRCSTEEQADRNLSLPAQESACRAWAEANDLTIESVYSDAGLSGGSSDRPALQRCLSDARDGRWEVLLVWDLSRLSRETADALAWWRELRQHEITLHAVSQPIGDGAEAELMATQLWSVATYQRRRLAVDVRRGVRQAAESGHWLGGPAPYGYERVDKRLVVDEVEASVVREMVRLRLECGLGTTRLARWLNDHGYRTRAGNRWTGSTVHNVLASPIYLGDTVYQTGRTERSSGQTVTVRSTHQPLMTRTEQAAIGLTRRRGEPRTPPAQRRRRRLLAGLIRCERCGRMRVYSSQDDGRHRAYYACRHCPGGGIRASVIEPAVLDVFVHHVLTPEVLAEAMLDAERQYAALLDRDADRRRVASIRVRRLQAEVRRLVEALAAGISSPSVREALAQREEQLDAAQRELGEVSIVPMPPPRSSDLEALAAEMREAIRTADREEQNRLLREWIAGIDYDRESDTLTLHVHHYGASRNHLTPWWCTAHVAS